MIEIYRVRGALGTFLEVFGIEVYDALLRTLSVRGGGLKTPTAIYRRPVCLGSWAAVEGEKRRPLPQKWPVAWPQEGQDRSKMALRGPKESPKRPQDGPKTTPRQAQNGPKMAPGGSKEI